MTYRTVRCDFNEVSGRGDHLCKKCSFNLTPDKLTGKCVKCTAGFECSNSQKNVCPPGFYSLENEISCTICPSKYYCPSPNIAIKCPEDALSVHGATKCQFFEAKTKSRSKRFVEQTCTVNNKTP